MQLLSLVRPKRRAILLENRWMMLVYLNLLGFIGSIIGLTVVYGMDAAPVVIVFSWVGLLASLVGGLYAYSRVCEIYGAPVVFRAYCPWTWIGHW